MRIEMDKCSECGAAAVVTRTVPSHTEDLGGITVTLKDCVIEEVCTNCGERSTEIPDLDGLLKAVALVRALTPIKLDADDVKLMRRALDMKSGAFAELMQISPEHLSRWEHGVKGLGGATDLLIRHHVCALLKDQVPAIAYDPTMLIGMKVLDPERIDGKIIKPEFVFWRIRVKLTAGGTVENGWDQLSEAA
jgi:hypothetical protein